MKAFAFCIICKSEIRSLLKLIHDQAPLIKEKYQTMVLIDIEVHGKGCKILGIQ